MRDGYPTRYIQVNRGIFVTLKYNKEDLQKGQDERWWPRRLVWKAYEDILEGDLDRDEDENSSDSEVAEWWGGCR